MLSKGGNDYDMTTGSTQTSNYSWWTFSARVGWRPFCKLTIAKGLRANTGILFYLLPLTKKYSFIWAYLAFEILIELFRRTIIYSKDQLGT